MTSSYMEDIARAVYDDGVLEVCNTLLATLPRADHRTLGELYVRGLLHAPGRKTIRNIASVAALPESSAGEQRLHHFISKSTWDWRPVRAALTRYVHDAASAGAWVVQPRIVEKSGAHSVGVRNSVVPCLGRTVNHQHVLAIWLVGPALACPVNWRLVLPRDWLTDDGRRRKVGIPDYVDCASPTECAISLVSDTVAAMGPLRRPVVMDARDVDTAAMIPGLTRRQVPYVLRLRGGTPVVAGDPAVGRYGGQAMPAQRLAELAKGLRQPVGDKGERLALRLQVTPTLNQADGGGQARHVMVAEWDTAASTSPQVWLTNMTDADTDALLGLSRLTQRVDGSFAAVSTRVGALDFEGRTFQGWHHHKTLVSLAHAIAELSLEGEVRLPAPAGPAPICTAGAR
ncbi:transposase [Dactylosporangium sp. NPDC051485]|uniref:IS701 family transposase n=1 Tax=Dactylosporangium sp. NPDC051485 TaxID=3154846 RepID=UPI003434C140